MSVFDRINHGSHFFTDLVAEARKGHFALPTFQRGIVWGESDILALLDSLWRGYPIGYLLLWGDHWKAHAQEVRPFQGCTDPVPHAALVLDGQQRIQAMLQATIPGSGYAYEMAGDCFVRVPDPTPARGFIPAHMLVDWIGFMHGMDVLYGRLDQAATHALAEQPSPPTKGKRKPKWSGMCPAGLHGLSYPGQSCDPCAAARDTPERRALREQILKAEKVLSAFKNARIGYIQIGTSQPIEFAREVFRRLNTAGKPFTEEEVFACLR